MLNLNLRSMIPFFGLLALGSVPFVYQNCSNSQFSTDSVGQSLATPQNCPGASTAGSDGQCYCHYTDHADIVVGGQAQSPHVNSNSSCLIDTWTCSSDGTAAGPVTTTGTSCPSDVCNYTAQTGFAYSPQQPPYTINIGDTVPDSGTYAGYAIAGVDANNCTGPFKLSCQTNATTGNPETLSTPLSSLQCPPAGANNCSIFGVTIADGKSNSSFFQTATIPAGQTCGNQPIECVSGSLFLADGKTPAVPNQNVFQTCVPGTNPPNVACTYTIAGVAYTLANNAVDSTHFFSAATVPYGSTCTNAPVKCVSGTLSPPNLPISCSVGPGPTVNNCTFSGQSILSAQSLLTNYYYTSHVKPGQTCEKVTVDCNNGVLTQKGMPLIVGPMPTNCVQDCSLADGSILGGDNQQNATLYYTLGSVSYPNQCTHATVTCSNGILSPANLPTQCQQSSKTSSVQVLADAQGHVTSKVVMIANGTAQDVTLGAITPFNYSGSGLNVHVAVSDPNFLAFFNPDTSRLIALDQGVAYQNGDGGRYIYGGFTVTVTEPQIDYWFGMVAKNLNCTLPNGATLTNGRTNSNNFFTSITTTYPAQCSYATVTCNNGQLSPPNLPTTCSPGQSSSCALSNGSTLANGQSNSNLYFSSSTTTYPAQCSHATVTCNNGQISPSGLPTTCTPGQSSGTCVLKTPILGGSYGCEVPPIGIPIYILGVPRAHAFTMAHGAVLDLQWQGNCHGDVEFICEGGPAPAQGCPPGEDHTPLCGRNGGPIPGLTP